MLAELRVSSISYMHCNTVNSNILSPLLLREIDATSSLLTFSKISSRAAIIGYWCALLSFRTLAFLAKLSSLKSVIFFFFFFFGYQISG